jgi:hypothetical protein
MSTKDTTASYLELSGEAYTLFIDAMATSNQRALDYTKSVWEIVSRPYSSSAVETAVRENFDRANQIVNLTIGELQASGKRSAELSEKLVAHAAKLQETYVHAVRGVVDTGISNVNYVKDTATQQFEDLSKRLDEMQTRIATPVSNN